MGLLKIRTLGLVASIIVAAGVGTAQTTATAEASGAAPKATKDNVTVKSIYEIPIEPMELEGATSATSLAAYKGKVLLLVNVASKCGFTKQYTGLEALHEKYKDQGLVVLGFPSNDFKGQEPGTEKEIVEFCRGRYGVSFPLFAKIHVTGDEKAPLYKYLTEGDHPGKGEVTWNFNKFLADRNGNVVAHYESKVTPEDAVLDGQIRALLAEKPKAR